MARNLRIGIIVGAAILAAVACGKKSGTEDVGGGEGAGTAGAPAAGSNASGAGTTGGRASGGTGASEGGEVNGGTGPGGVVNGGGTAGSAGSAASTTGGTSSGGAPIAGDGPIAGGEPGAGAPGAGGTGTGGTGTGGTGTGGAAAGGGAGAAAATGGAAGASGAAPIAGAAGGTAVPLCLLGTIECDNGLQCDGVETCDPVAAGADPVTGCLPGTPLECPDVDGIACTVEFCSAATDSCTSVRQDTVCNDDSFCNGNEICDPTSSSADPTTGCVAGEPVVCEEDQASCTTVTCDDTVGRCVFVPDDEACSDGEFCTGAEACDPLAPGADPTTGCVAGEEPCPADDFACTTDWCDEFADACVHTPDDAKCVDDSACNGLEFCDPEQGCTSVDPIDCGDDGATCTVEACSESTLDCATRVDPDVCGDLLCDPSDPNAVDGTGCVEKPCTTDANCLDADACNGVEYCDTSTGICRLSAPAVDCDDDVACTDDSCVPADGTCTHTPIQGFCRDTNLCNGDETCAPSDPTADAVTGCVAGTAPDCDDGIECTIDVCTPTVGCEALPNAEACDDGIFCNGEEVCAPGTTGANATTGCRAGTPTVCPDDGIACTSAVCDPVLDACVATTNNAVCPCGQTCDATQGCGNWCVIGACQGKVYACGDCADNDGDCLPDSADSACLGPCSDNEDGYKGNIPGQNNSNTCTPDCYFDGDSGGGNDGCEWDTKCDPKSVDPHYLPVGNDACIYYDNDPKLNASKKTAYAADCADYSTTQSTQCWDMALPPTGENFCGAITPNGCDCFGCCQFPGIGNVWLGTEDAAGNGTCSPDVLTDPSLTLAQKRQACWDCTQVSSCLNTCDTCEVCVGKPTVPPSCSPDAQCPRGEQPCGQPGQSVCPSGYYCITGCCQPAPQ